ncbi:hypothetical protein CC80DRAFT_543534 [Byssothecium circinans]|uniref:Uncharacterized protein n=1 Tax=Byssothecium circinans TaxID=147558 RepID=A0A6A5UE43_9PLEO|nr:hypothetical protein CC80DRAFT_543534 [Byssothecium circinans]
MVGLKREAALIVQGTELQLKRNKKSTKQKDEESARAAAGQAALDRGDALVEINPADAARFAAMECGEKVTSVDAIVPVKQRKARVQTVEMHPDDDATVKETSVKSKTKKSLANS